MNLKQITSFAFATLLSFSAFADFRVLHVQGEIYNETKKKAVQLGDIIAETEVLKVRSENAFCYLLNNDEKARYALKATSLAAGKVMEMFSPIPVRKAITSRGDENGQVLKLSEHFGQDSYVFLSQKEEVPLHPDYFDVSGESVFISKTTSGDQMIKSEVKREGNKLVFDLPAIMDGNEWEKFTMEIYQVNPNTKAFKKLGTVNASRLDLTTIKKEIENLKLAFGPMEPAELNKEISLFLADVYGHHNYQELEKQLGNL